MQLNRILRAAPLALAMLIAACGSEGGTGAPPGSGSGASPSPAPSPAPTGSALPTTVLPCFRQTVIGTTGQSLAELIIPDMVTLDRQVPSQYPNGRFPDDQVIDITLAAIFLDLSVERVDYFDQTNLMPDPPTNPAALVGDIFPYMAPPVATNERSTANGRTFSFETAPSSQATLVERVAMPAVATALIGGRPADTFGNTLTTSNPLKNGYNESNPTRDVAGDWRPELEARLLDFHRALADDFAAENRVACAR